MATCWRCCRAHKDQLKVDIADVLRSDSVPSNPDVFIQLLADIDQTMEGHGVVKKVPMSKEVENFASHLEKHLSEVILTVQVSKDAVNALDRLPWVGAGLTIIAMGLNLTLKTLENREQCSNIMRESLDLWRNVMQPVLETRGLASDYMGESISIIIEGYLYCRSLLNSRTLKRFLCASSHERELEIWRKKQTEFLMKATAVMNVDMIRSQFPRTRTLPKAFATRLVGLEKQKRDVLKLLKLEDMEETVVVVLHGMGGVGKSTLAEAVYKEASMSRERRRCRVKVGEKPSEVHISGLQKKMVEDLTGKSLQILERDEVAIEEELREVLQSKSGEPFLIYIDNVLQTKDLEDLFKLDCELIEIPKGSRLLVTTRDTSMCTKVFKRNRQFRVREFSVKVLNDEDARRLFFWHAFGEEEPSTEMVDKYDDGQGLIESMVSSVCGKLPLALRVLGRSLTDKNVSFWRSKYRELKSSQDFEFEDKVTNVLKLSYESLDPETQCAFLLACVCFYDHHIRRFNDCVTSLLPKATPIRLFELGLLERVVKLSDVKWWPNVRMHDLVRNLGFALAAERKYAYPAVLACKEDFSNIKYEAAWRELKWLRVPPLEDGIEAALLEKCEELEILVLHTHVNGHIKDPPQNLKAVYGTISSGKVSIELGKLKKLTVWDVYDWQKEFLVTPSTQSALQIYRGFRGPHISEEAIDCHKNTLRKLGCKGIVELSSYFCKRMTELQCLFLSDYRGDSFPKEMGSLVGLECLNVESPTIQEVPRSLVHLKRLQCLVLNLGNLKEIPRGVFGAMAELVWLDLRFRCVKYLPMQDIGQLVSLEVLVLVLPSMTCLQEDNIVSELKLEKLRWFCLLGESLSSLEGVCLSCPSLECLTLSLRKLQVLPSRFITAAPKLRSVRLLDCSCLQELSAGTKLLGAVKSLLVWGCPALKTTPEGLVKTVESLAVVRCRGMERLPKDVLELDEERAGDVRLLLCDAHLLPSRLLPFPPVLPYMRGDRRAEQRLASFIFAEFMPPTDILF